MPLTIPTVPFAIVRVELSQNFPKASIFLAAGLVRNSYLSDSETKEVSMMCVYPHTGLDDAARLSRAVVIGDCFSLPARFARSNIEMSIWNLAD